MKSTDLPSRLLVIGAYVLVVFSLLATNWGMAAAWFIIAGLLGDLNEARRRRRDSWDDGYRTAVCRMNRPTT